MSTLWATPCGKPLPQSRPPPRYGANGGIRIREGHLPRTYVTNRDKHSGTQFTPWVDRSYWLSLTLFKSRHSVSNPGRGIEKQAHKPIAPRSQTILSYTAILILWTLIHWMFDLTQQLYYTYLSSLFPQINFLFQN